MPNAPGMDCSRSLWDSPMAINTTTKNVRIFGDLAEPVPKNMVVNKRLVEKVGPEVFEKMGSTNIGDLYKDKFRETQLYQKEKNDLSIHPQPLFAGGKQKLVYVW